MAAVAWTLSWSAITGAIIGARKPEQVDGCIGTGEMVFTADELES